MVLPHPLARMEAHLAVNSVLARMPDLKILEDNPRWIPQMLIRGMESLPVSFAPGVGAVAPGRGS